MSYDYHIRYTCSGELQEQVVDFITRNALNFIISREFATREHIQCYVQASVVKKTWVNKFNIKFNNQLVARDKYVELCKDVERTKKYVCKGGSTDVPPVVLQKRGFTDDDIIIYHKQYWQEDLEKLDVNPSQVEKTEDIDKFLESLPKTIEKKVKKTKSPTFMRQVCSKLEEEYPEREWTGSIDDKRLVFITLLRSLGELGKGFETFILSRMIYGVLNVLIKDKEEWLEYWYQKCFGEDLNPHDEELINSLDN